MNRDRHAGHLFPGYAAATALAVAFVFGVSLAQAQGMMRSSGFGGGVRMPGLGSGGFGRGPNMVGGGRIGPGYVIGRGAFGPGYTGRMVGARDADFDDVEPMPRRRDQEFADRPARGKAKRPPTARTAAAKPPRSPPGAPTIPYMRYAPNPYPAALNRRYVPGQIVAEIDDAQADQVARRYRLTRVASQDVPLIGSSLTLFRIAGNRTVEAVASQLRADSSVRAVQPNFRYVLQDQTTKPASGNGDPAQYALAKLRLPEAHRLGYGSNVKVAVIDSAIDLAHPELAGAIGGAFDALGSKEGAHVHGTGIAGAIVSHARLTGSAPRAKLLAIRAFGVARGPAESSSFVILKAVDHAALNGAQVINMSFAGPQDPLLERGIAAAATRGIVMVAASGNAGPKSPPLYPAANPNVIAVTATDADDRLFAASSRGGHVALSAPGVDIFLPAPDGKYQMTSGTSFSAAYVSGLAALMIERNPQLGATELRAVLLNTARDLGPPGRDDLFGAGIADAYGAVSAVQGTAVPVAAAPAAAPEPAATNAQEAAVPATASEKP
ncbi:MAG: S8 family serine peptidase [Tardiphaga sp.]